MLVDKVDVYIIMGSISDNNVMCRATQILQTFDITSKRSIVSAHRTPERLYEFAQNVEASGVKVIIAGAGGAAHLPGMVAALTPIPVLGVPIDNTALNGIDSLYSIAQMPKGVPVATFTIGEAGAINAALFATAIMGVSNNKIMHKLKEWRESQTNSVPQEVS